MPEALLSEARGRFQDLLLSESVPPFCDVRINVDLLAQSKEFGAFLEFWNTESCERLISWRVPASISQRFLWRLLPHRKREIERELVALYWTVHENIRINREALARRSSAYCDTGGLWVLSNTGDFERHALTYHALDTGAYACLRSNIAFLDTGLSCIWGKEPYDPEAENRGLSLLKRSLKPEQLEQYEADGHFDVVGNKTGKKYRIRHGTSMNIYELDKQGNRVSGWCFHPQGALVAGDVLLAQKIALETDEAKALAIANKF